MRIIKTWLGYNNAIDSAQIYVANGIYIEVAGFYDNLKAKAT